MKKGIWMLAGVMIAAAIAASTRAQTASSSAASTPGSDVRAVTIIIPPFVMEEKGSLTGFSIELWNAIAARLKLRTIYQIVPDASAGEAAMLSRSADVTVAPVVITAARDAVFDFSIPTLEEGLQIMVRSTGERAWTESPLWDLLRLLFSRTIAVWLGIALLLVLVPAHLIWLLERRHPDGILNRKYFPGIFDAIYWAVSTLTTQAEKMPRQWVARAISIFWMFAGVVFVAFYTAQLTTTLTVEQIRGAIGGPGDLPGKRVATLSLSVAADYLREHHAQVQEYPTTDQMFEALLDKRADAVVFSAPVLLYYAAHEGKGRVKMVGSPFDTSPVAIMFQLDSPLRRKVDEALLALREDGTYQRLYEKWFGAP
ncbi:MAG: transporter substrate-binding domain-containing protein [Candidatus Binataceae bacterium]